MFEGQQAKTTNQTVTISRNGTQVAQSQEDLFFSVSPFKALGSKGLTGDYSVASDQHDLPVSASPPPGGQVPSPLDTIRTYKDSTKTVLTAITTRTWTLTRDPNAFQEPVAWFCINSVTDLLPGTDVVTETDCYKFDTSGNVLAFMLLGTFGGQSVTLQ
ncbi:hypothetical protein [Cupriavidus pinatubonensis]|nr:hypothetical protein [Cupriavidus pinatubonensis]